MYTQGVFILFFCPPAFVLEDISRGPFTLIMTMPLIQVTIAYITVQGCLAGPFSQGNTLTKVSITIGIAEL